MRFAAYEANAWPFNNRKMATATGHWVAGSTSVPSLPSGSWRRLVDWLTINPELKALQFSFSVGSVPLRYYKGDPDDPPSRYLTHSEGELQHIQLCFDFEGLPSANTILRLAVDVDATRQASSVSLVEIDEFKEVIGKYRIPFDAQTTRLRPMQTPPVNMPPIVAEPQERNQRREDQGPPEQCCRKLKFLAENGCNSQEIFGD